MLAHRGGPRANFNAGSSQGPQVRFSSYWRRDQMNTRRCFVVMLGLGICALIRPSVAQIRGRVMRIGWISQLSAPEPNLDAFREGLRDLGYSEGRDYVIVAQYAHGDPRRLSDLVADLVRAKVDMLVSRGPAIHAAKAASGSVPVLFAFSGDPVAADVVDSLSRPGRNATGVTFLSRELSAKRMELLKELAPRASRIAILTNPDHAGERDEYEATLDSAKRLGVATTRHTVQTARDIPPVFDAIQASRADAMLVFPDALMTALRKEIAAFALRMRLPSIYGWADFVEAGGLVSYGPNIAEQYRHLATFADKIMRGIDAGSIPVERPRTFEMLVNLATAKALGLTVPQSILLRADRVIE